MKIFVWITMGLLWASMAMAGPQPDDFAYGMPLSLEEGGAFYRLSLPLEVYQTVRRDDLGDIRVFNKANVAVPFMLRRSIVKSEQKEQFRGLPIFPLYQKKNSTPQDNLAVHFKKKPDGTILDIRSNGAQPAPGRTLTGYLIDTGDPKHPMDALDIFWQPPGHNFVTTLSLEHSADLTHWSTLVRRSTLAQMHYGGHQIHRRRVSLPVKPLKYIRLAWLEDGKGLAIEKILAVQLSKAQTLPRQWTALRGQPAAGPEPADNAVTAFEYDSAARLPADRLRIRFDEKNTLLEATLLSRADRQSPWRYRQKGTFYNLTIDHSALLQDTVSVGQTIDRYWRVEIAKDAWGDTQNSPKVALGWRPHELLFVARGEGPYMLAYGSARLGESASTRGTYDALARVIGSKEQALLKEAKVLPKIVLGRPDQLTPEPAPLPWRKWLLWGVLIAGVALIAAMALSLIKGINTEKG